MINKLKIRGGLLILNDSKSVGRESYTLDKDSKENILVKSLEYPIPWVLNPLETEFEGSETSKTFIELYDKLASVRVTVGSSSGGGEDIPQGVYKCFVKYNENNKLVAYPITAEDLSDFETPSPFEQGLLAYGPDPEKPGAKKLGWVDIGVSGGESVAESNTIPLYSPGMQGGQLVVKDALNDNHAVSLNQLNSKVPEGSKKGFFLNDENKWSEPKDTTYGLMTEDEFKAAKSLEAKTINAATLNAFIKSLIPSEQSLPDYLLLSYTASGSVDTDVKLSTGITGLENPIIMVQAFNDNAALFPISSGIRYDKSTGDIDFNVSALQDKEVYTYTVLIK